jgi:hypothetical protein
MSVKDIISIFADQMACHNKITEFQLKTRFPAEAFVSHRPISDGDRPAEHSWGILDVQRSDFNGEALICFLEQRLHHPCPAH